METREIPFSLSKAIGGAKIVDCEGSSVRLIQYDDLTDYLFIQRGKNNPECVCLKYALNSLYILEKVQSSYYNVYRNSYGAPWIDNNLYESESKAKANIDPNEEYIRTIEVEG